MSVEIATRTAIEVSGPEPIAIVIGQLGQGGSERQLHGFIAACDRRRWAPVVYVSGELGPWLGPIRELDVPVILLEGNPLAKMARFRRAYVKQGATCFFSWSSYTNGYSLALLLCGGRRIGSFRNALFADLPERYRRLWSWMSLAGIDTIVCNSESSRAELSDLVGTGKRIAHVPNVAPRFQDTDIPAWRRRWRTRLGVAEDQLLVVGVGRLAPQKNFHRFIDVVAEARRHIAISAVIAGEDRGCLEALRDHAVARGVDEHVRFLGGVSEGRELIAAADILLLTSDF